MPVVGQLTYASSGHGDEPPELVPVVPLADVVVPLLEVPEERCPPVEDTPDDDPGDDEEPVVEDEPVAEGAPVPDEEEAELEEPAPDEETDNAPDDADEPEPAEAEEGELPHAAARTPARQTSTRGLESTIRQR